MNESQIADESTNNIYNALCRHYNEQNPSVIVPLELHAMIKVNVEIAMARIEKKCLIEENERFKGFINRQGIRT